MIYDLIAPIYDAVNGDIDYSCWADFIEENIKKYYKPGKPELVLDLGCGTGRMLCELASRGYDMTGVDYSAEMLDKARTSAEEAGLADRTLLLCQDIREFELYGTVDVTVSCLDTVNHITSPKDLRKCFDLVHNYLIPDGLFIFDINGKYKFENLYGNESYVLEDDGSFCVWQNFYNQRSHLCDFVIDMFLEKDDGSYVRQSGLQTERMYTLRAIKSALKETGFEFVGAYSDFDFTPATDECERIYIIARCIKEN